MESQRDGRLLSSPDISTEMENSGLLEQEPGLPAVQKGAEAWPLPFGPAFGSGLPTSSLPPVSAVGGYPPAQVPEVGEEIADLGWEL
eukprot:6488083-Amphidinium_carterae.1